MTRRLPVVCRILSLALAVAFSGRPGTARGEPLERSPGYVETTPKDAAQKVIFDDDLMSGASNGPILDIFKGRRTASRELLIRPRFHFVSEMLKSVESL